MIQLKEGQPLPPEIVRMRNRLQGSLALLLPVPVVFLYISWLYDSISLGALMICLRIYAVSFANVVIAVAITVYLGSSQLIRVLDTVIAHARRSKAVEVRRNALKVPEGPKGHTEPVSQKAKSEESADRAYVRLRRFHLVYLRVCCYVVAPSMILVCIFFAVDAGVSYTFAGLTTVQVGGIATILPLAVIVTIK